MKIIKIKLGLTFLTFCFTFGLLIVSAGTNNNIGLIASGLLFVYTAAFYNKLDSRRKDERGAKSGRQNS